jgi:hypothetical protein
MIQSSALIEKAILVAANFRYNSRIIL